MTTNSLDALPAAMAAVEATLTQAISHQFAELRAMIADLAQSTTAKYNTLEQRVQALERLPVSVAAATMKEVAITAPARQIELPPPPPMADKETPKVAFPDDSTAPLAKATTVGINRNT
ncbi:unnamed protein product [Linum trigynum]|uniref:Uncharacterized protein n=1 Tax=Linum trigynum TaxID=586398 RepID=A0AAV2GTW3_9ROSI